MFRRRFKGRELIKLVSYIYLCLLLGFICIIMYMFSLDQILSPNLFILIILATFVNFSLFLICYISSKKVKKDFNLCIICTIVGIISFLWYFNWIGLILSILLLIAIYDMKK